MVLYVENVRINPEKGRQILSSLEQVPTRLLTKLSDRNVEQLVHVQLSGGIDFLAEKLYELISEHGIDPHLLNLFERVCDFSLVLLEVNDLLVDNELLWVLGEKV